MFTIRYGKTMVSCATLAVATLLLTLVLTHTGPAKPRPAPRPQGSVPTDPVAREAIKPGNYATVINIHNPSLGVVKIGPSGPVTLYKKAVISRYEGEEKRPPSGWHEPDSLAPDHAMHVDCTNIWEFLRIGPGTPAGGFVVILATGPVDVYGVYTAEPPTVTTSPLNIPGIALEVLPIEYRRVYAPGRMPPAAQYYEYSAKFLCGDILK